MSVFNGEKFIKEAIDSILTQTYTNFELLIVNDSSTDATLDIITSYDDKRIVLINNIENLGLTKSLNKGMVLSKGKYIARQDADDISHENRLLKQVTYLESNPEVTILGTQSHIINKKGEILSPPIGWKRPVNKNSIRWFCMFDSPFYHSSVMMKRDVIQEQFDGYNENYRTSQDFELWSRVVYKYDCANLDEKLISFRYHNSSISKNYNSDSIKRMKQIMENAILECLKSKSPKGFVEELSKLINYNSSNRFLQHSSCKRRNRIAF